jgi:hypothetical protein
MVKVVIEDTVGRNESELIGAAEAAIAAGKDERCIISHNANKSKVRGLVMARATCHCKPRENIWGFTFKAKILTGQNVRSLDRLK